MERKCGICTSVWPRANDNETVDCKRTKEHKGPHLTQRNDGVWYLWQSKICDDLTCEGCYMSDCWEDACEVFGEVPPDVAEQYLTFPEHVGEGWEE